MGWLTGWSYRKSHEIEGSEAGEQTDYQIKHVFDIFSDLPENAASFQTTPTSDGSGQCVHPSILYFPDGWNGYKYWMVMTPYPGENDDYETPEILVCDDGVNWVVPTGLTNPIVARDATNPNTDPNLFYNEATDELWVYYRKVSATYNRLYLKKSSDGVNWGGTGLGTLLLDLSPGNLISPSVEKVGSTYHLWYGNTADSPNTLKHRTSTDGETWGSEGSCNLYGAMPSGKELWHLEVRWISAHSEYWAMLTVCNLGQSGSGSWQMFARSMDAIDWYLYPEVWLKPKGGAWDSLLAYKSTFILSGSTVKIWYSACSTAIVWHIGYTTATLETAVGYMDMFKKMKTDGGDLRFTKDDGTTELVPWLETFDYYGGRAIIWVKIPTIPASPGSVTIYIYYGNSEATTTSDGVATFPTLFDDFLGDSLNPTIWNVDASDGQVTVADSIVKVEGNPGNYRYSFCSKAPYRASPFTALRFFAKLEKTAAAQQITQLGWGTWGINPSATFQHYQGSGFTNTRDDDGNLDQDVISNIYFDAWLRYDILRNGTTAKYCVSESLINTGDADPDTGTIGAQFYCRDSEYDLYCDWILIRKYAEPEPSHGSWGEEEFPLIEKDFSDIGGGAEVFGTPFKAFPFSEVGGGIEAFQIPFKGMGFLDQGLGSETFGVFQNKYFTEVGEGLDVFSKIITFLKAQFSDVGEGIDAFETPYREVKFTDIGSGADAFTNIVLRFFMDTGNGIDVFQIGIQSKGFSDISEGADAFNILYREMDFLDIGQGADAFSIPFLTKGFSDIGIGSEVFKVFLNQLAFLDAGEGLDIFTTPYRDMGFADSGSGADVFSMLYRELGFSDEASGIEVFVIPLKGLGFSDDGLGSDIFKVAVFKYFADVGSGADVFEQILVGWLDKFFNDTGTGTDIFAIIYKALPFVDSGLGTDSFVTPYREMKFIEEGSGADVFVVILGKEFGDTGSGADLFQKQIFGVVPKQFLESGYGSDAFVIFFKGKGFAEEGLGTDEFAIPHREMEFIESGLGTDVFALAFKTTDFGDSGLGTDAFETAYRQVFFADTAHGAEVFSKILTMKSVDFAELGEGTDLFLIPYKIIRFQDLGEGLDAFLLRRPQNFFDAGLGTDIFTSFSPFFGLLLGTIDFYEIGGEIEMPEITADIEIIPEED
ncbi:MAG: DUF2341 domain-containing protein [Desulfobacterales bacterium]|nr:DUF2341 domain-containing protein [Desulfobacterales bacterium]